MKPKEPHFLCRDDSGHYYLVAESSLIRFNELVDLINQDENGDEIWRAWDKLKKTQIDGPHCLKILEWEEI